MQRLQIPVGLGSITTVPRKELVGFLFGGVDRCEQLIHGLAVGGLVGLELLSNLLSQTPDRVAVRLEFGVRSGAGGGSLVS